jgi:hypothetical protein
MSERAGSFDDKALTELVHDLSQDTTALIRQETELFRREIEMRLHRVERHVKVLGAGSVIVHIGVLALAAALILLLNRVMPDWSAALLVGGASCVAGAVLITTGKKKLAGQTLTPQLTVESVERDVRAVREATA